MSPTGHLWIRGAARRDRERLVARLQPAPLLVPTVSAHRRLRGPYTAAGTVLRAVVPGVLATDPELVRRYDVEILSAAPELRGVVPATRETLTSLAVPRERTRYYSRLRTQRLAHGLTEFLRDHVTAQGPRCLVVEDVDQADATDAELLATLLRRVAPEVLSVVVCTGSGDLPEGPLAAALDRYAEAHDSARSEPPGPVVARLAADYVRGDCTSDDPAAVAAYDVLDASERRRLHDERADDLEGLGEPSLLLGAVPFHREHGSDPAGAGAAALEHAVDACSALGFYHATVELAERARALVGWDQGLRRYVVTSRMTTALAVLGRAREVEELYDEARQATTMPVVHMGAAYATAMLYTRHHDPEVRDNRTAKAWINEALAIASLYAEPRERVFHSVFMRNGLALVEMHGGNLETALGLVDEGIDLLDRELAPDEHRLHRSVLRFNRGQLCAALGRLDEAVADYTTVLEQDPNYPEYSFDRGNLLRRLGRDDEAMADYERAIALSPPFHEAYYNRGDLRLTRGDVAGALADFDYVLELDPDFVDAYVNRAGVRLDEGDVEGARRDAREGLRLDPDNPHLRVVDGRCHAEDGDLLAARDAFDRALRVDAGLVSAWSARAAVHDALGCAEGALADLCRAVALAPDEPDLLYNRAHVLRGLGRRADALRDLEAAAVLAPDDPDVQDALRECRALRSSA